MDVDLMFRVLACRAALARHDRWSPAQLATHQARVEGREQDTVTVTTARGPVNLHPNVFHTALDDLNVAGWQVVQETHDSLRLLVVPADAPVDLVAAQRRVGAALTEAGPGR